MSAKLQISSRENLAVPAKEWYLNVWIFVRNLLANKTKVCYGKGDGVKEKRKARERLFGGRQICENVKETWRKSAEEKRLFRGKTLKPSLASPPESKRSLSELPQVLSGSAVKKREQVSFYPQNSHLSYLFGNPPLLEGAHDLLQPYTR